VKLSLHPAPQYTSLVKGTPLKAITRRRSLAHALSGYRLASGLQYACAPAIRLKPILPPCPLVYRPHVSISSALPKALASWGIPLLCSIRLATCSGYAGELQGVTPFRVSIFRDFRTVLYAVSLIRIEWKPPIGLVGGRMGTCPVWACLRLLSQPSAGLAGSNSRRFRCIFVACP